MTSTLSISTREPTVILASGAQVAVQVHLGEPTVAHLDAMERQLRALRAKHPGGLGLLFVVGEGSSAPSGPARARGVEMFGRLRDSVKIVSAAILGTGFRASAKRSVFTMFASTVFGTARVKVFGDLDEAGAWLTVECAKAAIACPPKLDLLTEVRALMKP